VDAAQDPSVSVVIPTWNRAADVTRTVPHVLTQADDGLELIVVDDGSSDGTWAALDGIDDPRLRVVAQAHRGRSAARNLGASVARGDWLVFLDDDDRTGPEWLAVLGRCSAEDGVGVVTCGVTHVGRDGQVERRAAPAADAPVGEIAARFLAGTFAVRRWLFDEVGAYDEAMAQSENTDLGIRVVLACRAKGLGIVADTSCPLWHPAHSSRLPPDERALALLDAATRTLVKYPQLRELDRGFWLAMLDTAGVNAARLGRLHDARRFFLRAARTYPPAGRRVARLALALSRHASARVWKSQPPSTLVP
jgi:glycosyltransferase involved in cell wall biosynthesis